MASILKWLEDAAYDTFYGDQKKALERSNQAAQQQAQANKQLKTGQINRQQYGQTLRSAANVAQKQVPQAARPVGIGEFATKMNNATYGTALNVAKAAPGAVKEFTFKGQDNRNFADNAADMFAGNTARLINTANSGVVQPIRGIVQGKSPQQINAEMDKNLHSDRGGLLNAGTFFPTKEKYNQTFKDPGSFIKGASGAGIGVATEVVPLARGASLLAKPGLTAGQKIARGAVEGAVYGGSGTAGQQLVNDGRLDGKEIAKGAAIGAVSGAALPLAGMGASKLAHLPKQVRENALKQAGSASKTVSLPVSRLTSYEGAPDKARVEFYKNQIIQGKPVDDIYVMRDSKGKLGIEDGKHKFQAYKELGIKNVPVKVVDEESIKKTLQGGYARIPGGKDAELPSRNGRSDGIVPISKSTLDSGGGGTATPSYPEPAPSLVKNTGTRPRPVTQGTGQLAGFLQSPVASPKRLSLPNDTQLPGQTQLPLGVPVRYSAKVDAKMSTRNIPVRKLATQGDRVTATNVNPNIKAREKRFALDDQGELIPDTNGAYRIFTNEDGRVTNFRVGDQVFNAKDIGDLSDVNDYGSTLATMRRNVERGFGKETGEKVNKFLVDHQQQQATKMIERQLQLNNGMKQVADDLGISFGIGRGKAKRVSAAIQDFGEGQRARQTLVDEFGPEMANKIVKADAWFRGQYDSLLDEMNTTLTQFGYPPVPKRKNYYTHFQEPSLWQSFGLKMQEIKNLAGPTMQDATPDAVRAKIPNKLAGESEFTLPNKKFNKYALQRKGDTHTSDAFTAFEKYLTPTLNNIYMTPSITRARVLAKAVAQDADVMGKDANKIIIQTKEWANRLAGKSSRFDRPLVDSKGGQVYLKAARWAQSKAGANTIVGNLSTAVMQPIVLGQTTGKFGVKNTILAIMQEMSVAHGKNAPIRQSEFMKRRYSNLAPITRGKLDRTAEIANTPLKVVEETAGRITWNAAHNDALSKGLKGTEAIRYADIQTEKTLAGRSIGERPELFESKAAGPLTMYQLEVNNFWQQFGKEMTKEQAAKTMVAAYGLNLLLQAVSGRQVGFNPIDAVIDSYDEAKKEGKEPLDKAKAVGQRLAGEVVDNIPFVAPLANATIGDKNLRGLLGPTSNVGRFGVSSPISALASTTNVGGIPIPQNLILPFGGSQAKKTYEGLTSFLEGKVTDKNDKTMVQIPQTMGNALRGSLFGKGAIPEVNQYYENIGKKKIDQVKVQNQTNSSASNMGQSTPENAGDAQQAVFPGTDKNERLKESAERVTKERFKFSPSLSKDSQKVLETYARLSEQGKTNYKKNPENRYKVMLAEFERDKTNGSLSEAAAVKKEKTIKRYAVEKSYKQDELDMYGMSKTQLGEFVGDNTDRQAKLASVFKLDQELYDAGLIEKLKFKGTTAKLKGGKKGGKKGAKGKLTSLPSLGKVRQASFRASIPNVPSFKKGGVKAPPSTGALAKLLSTRIKTA